MRLPDLLRLIARPVPCWTPIGLRDGQELIDVRLRTGGTSTTVERDHVIVALVPLTIAVGATGIERGELAFIDRRTNREIGTLELRNAPDIDGTSLEVSFLRVVGGRHYCLPAGFRAWQRLLQANWRHDGGFRMSNTAIQHLMLFYLRPRPVVLVSVDDGVHDNLFPMDLIGPLRGYFTLALRNSSPSVATLRASRHVALADVALHAKRAVYGLGKHHKLAQIDWSTMPFEASRTANFGLRVPANALRVRECIIDSWHEVGSHTFFVTRVIADHTIARDAGLHHTCGIHRVYREQAGELPWSELDAA